MSSTTQQHDSKATTVRSEDGSGVAAVVEVRAVRVPQRVAEGVLTTRTLCNWPSGTAEVISASMTASRDYDLTILVADPREVRADDVAAAVFDEIDATDADAVNVEVRAFYAVTVKA